MTHGGVRGSFLTLNILPIEGMIFLRFKASHSSDSKLIFLPIWDQVKYEVDKTGGSRNRHPFSFAPIIPTVIAVLATGVINTLSWIGITARLWK